MIEKYEKMKMRLLGYSTFKLLKLLNAERNKPGWTSTRSIYISALRKVLETKETDYYK